jgi:hypothetical protein
VRAAVLLRSTIGTVTSTIVKKKPLITVKPTPLSSVLPASSPRTTSVRLAPTGKVKPGQTDQIEIIAADITDAQGRALDGKDNGQAVGNFIAKFGQGGLKFSQPSAVAASARLSPSAVDAALPGVDLRRKGR